MKPDAYLGGGPALGWGRLYGGQVVAQALRAACLTVDPPHRPQSLHAYFVRAGDEDQPVLYEVERVRDSRTVRDAPGRRVPSGRRDPEPDRELPRARGRRPRSKRSSHRPTCPRPESLPDEPTNLLFERHERDARAPIPSRTSLAWMRARGDLGDDPALHACAFAYLSDEFPLGAALGAHPLMPDWEQVFTASLDHAIWFHREFRADEWLLFELRGGGVADAAGPRDGPGLRLAAGRHVASIAQEAWPGTAARRLIPATKRRAKSSSV